MTPVAANDIWQFSTGAQLRYEEIPKIVFLLFGITFLLAGLSYLMGYERNAKGICITVVGVAIIFVYFFVLPH
jgi:hypothetical protein